MAKDILIGWCDNGTVESRFMDGILSLYMAKERGELDVNLNATKSNGLVQHHVVRPAAQEGRRIGLSRKSG